MALRTCSTGSEASLWGGAGGADGGSPWYGPLPENKTTRAQALAEDILKPHAKACGPVVRRWWCSGENQGGPGENGPEVIDSWQM